MNAITIKAKVEGDIVTMDRAEFERIVEMLEDAQDTAAIDDVKRKLVSGEEETVSAEFVDRMLAGESLVRLWREHRRLTGKALAEQAGPSAPSLTQIEEGQREPQRHHLEGPRSSASLGDRGFGLG